MTEYGSPRVRDEWVVGTLSQPGHWQPACPTQRSRHFARYRPAIRNGNRPAIWLEDIRGEGGTPLTGARREYRG